MSTHKAPAVHSGGDPADPPWRKLRSLSWGCSHARGAALQPQQRASRGRAALHPVHGTAHMSSVAIEISRSFPKDSAHWRWDLDMAAWTGVKDARSVAGWRAGKGARALGAGRFQDGSASRDGSEEQSSGYGRGKERAGGQRRTTAAASDAESNRMSLLSARDARPLEDEAHLEMRLKSPSTSPDIMSRLRKICLLSCIRSCAFVKRACMPGQRT